MHKKRLCSQDLKSILHQSNQIPSIHTANDKNHTLIKHHHPGITGSRTSANQGNVHILSKETQGTDYEHIPPIIAGEEN